MSDEIKKKSTINIEVGLNEERMPIDIKWRSSDGPDGPGEQAAKAFLLSIFDKDNKDTLRIDLWTKEMQVIEMDRFVFQTLRGLADTYFKATQNADLAADMQRFVQYFGEKTEIIPKK
ncbi:MAG: gliding motility protein GldC [Bacteroidetes bacterium]|jgi:gliding motility-associated protein GldC|nr:gliding motility protein GldC [Bacteroidota bacterium]